MSINLRTGQPGHGKSYGAVRCIRDSLERGEWVATNIPLVGGWALTMARTNWIRRLIPGRCAKTAARYEARMYFVDDLAKLRRLRLPPCGKCPGCRKGPGCQKEGRGRAVLDEAHKWLNARTWDADETGVATTKAEAVRRRLDIIGFFSTHRHFGWHIELITQDDANLDRQVRTLFEYHTHLKNLRRYKVLGLFPIVPFNVFVAVTHWHDNEKSRLGVESYLLNKRLARCYDTFGAARALEHDPDAIWLGGTPGAGPDARSAPPGPPLPPAPGTHGADNQLASGVNVAAAVPRRRWPASPSRQAAPVAPDHNGPAPLGAPPFALADSQRLDPSDPATSLHPVPRSPVNAETPELTAPTLPIDREMAPRDDRATG